jgi:glycosyltransferase involved in cell wall biosynthesis
MSVLPGAPAIGHVVLSLDVGGLERVVANLARAQRDAGARVVVYCLDRAGDLAAPLPGAGIAVRTVGRRRSGFDPSAVVRLWRMLRADHVGIVHCHNHGALVYGSLAARLVRRTPVVYTVHGAHTSSRRATARFLKLGLVREVVFVSAHAREIARVAGLAGDAHVHTVVNGVDVDAFARAGEGGRRVREELGIPASAPVCGIVARLTPAKDHATLLEAVARLRAAVPGVHCLVVGDGELRDELAARSRALGLEGSVHFTGARENVADYLAAMDVFVLSSVTEGLAMTLLEAMAAARPVVATAVGGNPEAVEDGRTGTVVPAKDPEALAGAVRSFLADPEAAATVGAAGRQRARERFSLEAMARRYAAIYGAAGAAQRGGGGPGAPPGRLDGF